MIDNPLLEKLKNKKTALGLRVASLDLVEVCGVLGFDWFMVDHMFTPADWGFTRDMIRTGWACGISPIVRVQANPWVGYNPTLASEVQRAFGIGAQFVMVSHSDKREIEACLKSQGDWHRNALTVHPYRSREDWVTKIDEVKETSFVIPHLEAKSAYEQLDETFDLPGVKLFFFAMTDASKALTGETMPDWNHPELWKFIDKAVKKGEERGIAIGANTSYAYSMKEMEERTLRLHNAGVRFIYIQSAGFLFQTAIGDFLGRVKGKIKD